MTDSAGDTFTRLVPTWAAASDKTQMSVWTAPIVNGGGATPVITAKPSGTADVAVAAVEYQGLSTASGSTVLDTQMSATGSTTTAGTVSSGATPTTSGNNELAMGFYADSGSNHALGAGSGYASRVNVSPTSDIQLLLEDQVLAAKGTPNASASDGGQHDLADGHPGPQVGGHDPAHRARRPSAVAATAGNGSATVTWTAPDNGGALISSYTVTPYVGRSGPDAGDGVQRPAGAPASTSAA